MPRSTFRRIRLPLAAALALAVQACSDWPESTPTSAPESAPAAARAVASTGPADDLARGIALALSAPELRRQVLEDMRDSPFPQHRLHLASYLRGQRGASLARAAARSLGMTPGAYVSLIARLPELELHFDRPYDRALWTGTADVAVVGMGRSFEELYAESGAETRVTVHTTDGQARSMLLDEHFGPPLLLVRPAKVDFGADPEARRAKAPRRTGRSITTRQEEYVLADTEPGMGGTCDNETAIVPCTDENGGSSVPRQTGYRLAYSYSQCVNPAGGADADWDGILDDCEAAVAHAFRPGLRFDQGEQHATRDSYWSVRRSNIYPNSLAVFYMLGYHRDNGDVVAGRYAHDGDGEFIGIGVHDLTGNGSWALEEVTYSAHWHKLWDRTDESRYYDPRVEYADGVYRGRVRSWVAESKHANYGKQDICNDHVDNCNNPQSSDTPFNVDPARNIGNYWAAGIRLFNGPCATTIYVSQPYTECFWTDEYFRGWQSENGDGGGGYKYPLEWYDY